MSAAELFGLIVAVAVFAYLCYALFRGESSDGAGLPPDRRLPDPAHRPGAASRRLHRQGLPGRTGFPVPRLRPNRALQPTGCCACGPRTGRTGRPTPARALVFSLLSWLLLYLILRTQSIQPFNPEGFGSGPWNLSFNTTSSFVTNTNWQYYGGETTLTYFAQMAGLTVQNFVSAAVGIAVLAAVIRGFASRSASVARQLLARPDPDHPLHPAADLASSPPSSLSPRV